MSRIAVSFVTESPIEEVLKAIVKYVEVGELHIDGLVEPISGNYSHVNTKGQKYYLNCKEVTMRGGKKQPIYYFSVDARPKACPLPEGYRINENPRNGFLTVQRI